MSLQIPASIKSLSIIIIIILIYERHIHMRSGTLSPGMCMCVCVCGGGGSMLIARMSTYKLFTFCNETLYYGSRERKMQDS